jgi:hypothetical protein
VEAAFGQYGDGNQARRDYAVGVNRDFRQRRSPQLMGFAAQALGGADGNPSRQQDGHAGPKNVSTI